jgi:RHS repeat-associated protein
VSRIPGYPSGVGVCVTRYLYDPAGNHVRTVLPTSNGSDNRFVVYAYTDDNLLATVDAPSPAQTSGARSAAMSYLYDGDRRPVRQTDALGHQQTTTYTSDELVARQATQPSGSTTHITSNVYDASANLTSTTDALNQTSHKTYYADGLSQDVIDPLGDQTHYVYDAVGNLTQSLSPSAVAKDATNSSGTPTANTYTFDNLPLTSTSPVAPNGGQRRRNTYGYDAGGRKVSQAAALVNPQGTVTSDGGSQSFSYYQDDRLAAQTGRNGTGETINHSYDPAGNLSSVQDSTSGGSRVSVSYYLDDLPRSVDDGSRSSLYSYDGSGQRAARADQVDGSSTRFTTSYSYGDAELPASMTSSLVGGKQTAWTYDAAGRLTQENDPNGQTVARSFNPDDTLASQVVTNSSSASVVANWGYTYDGDYRITAQTYSGLGGVQGKLAYGYDAAGRVSSFTNGSNPTQNVSWDRDSNRLSFGSVSATYNADDSMASTTDSSGTHPQVYSARGDLVNDGCFTYGYDGFDRMSSASVTGVAGCPTVSASYSYDGLDRQRSTGSTALHYDGLSQQVVIKSQSADTAYELSPSGQPKAVAAQAPATATLQYLSDDGHGNVTTVTNPDDSLACGVRYDPWGSPVSAQSPQNPCNTGSTIDDHFYRGQRRDPITGNYQLGNRSYAPSKAAFLSPDTYRIASPAKNLSVGADPLTHNRYTYVNGDPVNLADPNGHMVCENDSGPCNGPLPASSAAPSFMPAPAPVAPAIAVPFPLPRLSFQLPPWFVSFHLPSVPAPKRIPAPPAQPAQPVAPAAEPLPDLIRGPGQGVAALVGQVKEAVDRIRKATAPPQDRPREGYSPPPERPHGGYSPPPERPHGGYSPPPERPREGYSPLPKRPREGYSPLPPDLRNHTLYSKGQQSQDEQSQGRQPPDERIPDEALVVRGGVNDAERIRNGSGVWVDSEGNVHDVSVNSAADRSEEELAAGIPNKQIGVTTAGEIREAGGTIEPDPLEGNPYHCLVGSLPAETLSGLLTPTVRNPCA